LRAGVSTVDTVHRLGSLSQPNAPLFRLIARPFRLIAPLFHPVALAFRLVAPVVRLVAQARRPVVFLSRLQQRAYFSDDLVGHVDLQIVSAG